MAKRKLPIREHLFAHSRIDPGGCWVWAGACDTRKGHEYGFIRIGDKIERVHRVAYQEFIGPLGGDDKVLHKCDNPPCWRPDHLYKGTQLENVRDRGERGRTYSKLTPEQIKEIRQATRRATNTIARQYGVSWATIQRVLEKP